MTIYIQILIQNLHCKIISPPKYIPLHEGAFARNSYHDFVAWSENYLVPVICVRAAALRYEPEAMFLDFG